MNCPFCAAYFFGSKRYFRSEIVRCHGLLLLIHLVALWTAAGKTCTTQEQRAVAEEAAAGGGNSFLQHASRQVQDGSKGGQNGTQFPNPFQVFGGQSGSMGTSTASGMANIFLGSADDASTMQECSTFLNQVLAKAFSDPSQAMTIITDLMSSSQGSTQSLGCLKAALNYADRAVTPAECRMSDGTVDPSCCVYEKRCSDTNPLDGCPAAVFRPTNIFDLSTMPVTCVGSKPLSPVATGMCKCKGGKACIKGVNQPSQCM